MKQQNPWTFMHRSKLKMQKYQKISQVLCLMGKCKNEKSIKIHSKIHFAWVRMPASLAFCQAELVEFQPASSMRTQFLAPKKWKAKRPKKFSWQKIQRLQSKGYKEMIWTCRRPASESSPNLLKSLLCCGHHQPGKSKCFHKANLYKFGSNTCHMYYQKVVAAHVVKWATAVFHTFQQTMVDQWFPLSLWVAER